jgi:multiple sugar transport system substrate-binding protein
MKKALTLCTALAVALLAVTPALAQEDQPVVDWSALEVEEGAVLAVSGWGDATEQQVVLDSIERFNEVFPDVEVNFEPIPNDFQTIMKANMAGGTAADVFYVDADLMTAFGRNNQLLALDEYMEIAGLSRDDYVQALIDMFTYEGVTYGLPKDMGSLGLVYLPAIFDDAGVDYPTEDWTWDDMTAAAQAIFDATGVPGMCVPPDVGRWPAAVYQAGGAIVNEDFTEAVFNSEEAVTATEFWYGMYADGYGAWPTDIGVGWCGEALGRELTAMAWEGGWMINYMNLDFPDVEFVIKPLPEGPAGDGDLLFTNAWSARADTEYPVAAAALAMFLSGPENQEAILQTGFAIPTLVSLLGHPWFDDHPNEAAIAQGAAGGQVFWYGPEHGEVLNRMGTALESIFLGEKDIQTALDEAVESINTEVFGAE